MMSNEICVPVSALSQGSGEPTGETMDEGSADMVGPEGGDEVDFSGKGKVSRIEGDNAYVTVTEVNGEPCGHGVADNGDQSPAPDDEASMDDAVNAHRTAAGGY